jgi:hypothetical protein
MSYVRDSGNAHGVGRNAATVTLAGAVVGLLAGAALGVFWWALAPRVSIVVVEEGIRTDGFQPQEYLSSDIAFGALALGAGLLVTIGLVYMRREHLIATLFAALLSAIIGTSLMWFVGTSLGSVNLSDLDLPVSSIVQGPLEVRMNAMFLVWPLTAAAVVSILALSDFLSSWRNPEPQLVHTVPEEH